MQKYHWNGAAGEMSLDRCLCRTCIWSGANRREGVSYLLVDVLDICSITWLLNAATGWNLFHQSTSSPVNLEPVVVFILSTALQLQINHAFNTGSALQYSYMLKFIW